MIKVSMSDELKRFISTGGRQAREQTQKGLDEVGILGESAGKIELTPSVKSNRLRSSWHWENNRKMIYTYSDNKNKVYDGLFSERPGKQEVFIGTNVEYADDANKRSRSRGYMEKTAAYVQSIFDDVVMKHLNKIN